MNNSVRVLAPSRLHFGLLRLAQNEGRSFGGLGLMLDRPRVVVELREADRFSATGPQAERALQYARQTLLTAKDDETRAIEINVSEAPSIHSGLGTGTQLALAVAQGVRELLRLPKHSAEELASSVGRGQRSAVGTHGFFHGGLIWERGHRPGEPLGELARSVAVPEPWRIVLFQPEAGPGLHGEGEISVFAKLPPVAATVSDRLQRLAEEEIVPACQQADFDTFAEAVFQYGFLSGSCFSTAQGGPYASPGIARWVDRLREQGVLGVGQSSWGPSLFCLFPSEATARQFVECQASVNEAANLKFTISSADNRGALIEASPQLARL